MKKKRLVKLLVEVLERENARLREEIQGERDFSLLSRHKVVDKLVELAPLLVDRLVGADREALASFVLSITNGVRDYFSPQQERLFTRALEAVKNFHEGQASSPGSSMENGTGSSTRD